MPLLYVVGGGGVPGTAGLPGAGPAQAGALLMTANGIFQLVLYLVVLLALAKPLGAYMARVYEGRRARAGPRARPARAPDLPRCAACGPNAEMGWKTYALAMLLFNLARPRSPSTLLQRLQGVLPLNPQGLGAVSPDSSFNTAVSFATNTNWQGYGGETTHELPDPDARPRPCRTSSRRRRAWRSLVALIRGFARALGRDDRQLLGRSDARARSTSCCRCRSCSRSSWSRRAWCRPSARTRHVSAARSTSRPTGRQAVRRQGPVDRSS